MIASEPGNIGHLPGMIVSFPGNILWTVRSIFELWIPLDFSDFLGIFPDFSGSLRISLDIHIHIHMHIHIHITYMGPVPCKVYDIV